MYDSFEVIESGHFIQTHAYLERSLANFLKTRQISLHSPQSVICTAISPYCIQSIVVRAINQYLAISAQEYESGPADETSQKLERCTTALTKLYEALYPTDKKFAASEIGRNETAVPDWAVKYGENAKKVLQTILSGLSEIEQIGKTEKTIYGSYQLFRNSRIENVKTECNELVYYFRNSVWNTRHGDMLWKSMLGTAFDPKCWCAVEGNQVRNYDNTVTEINESFNPGQDGFYFRNPLDSWQLQCLMEIVDLLNSPDLLSILAGKRNCCGRENFIIYSSSNYYTQPLTVTPTKLNAENMLPFFYLKSEGESETWAALPIDII